MKKIMVLFIAVVLSVLFTLALTYMTLEVPMVIHEHLKGVFPDYQWPRETYECLRPLGYVSFAAVLSLMFAGFLTRRRQLAILGSIALYLPTFGYLVFTMFFFFAGIGVLRVLWAPLFDSFPYIIRLGDVVCLPFFLLTRSFVSGAIVTGMLSFVLIALGLLVLFLGILTWLYGRFKGLEIIDFLIYKRSRHPQYLGFLLWSYGLLLLATFLGTPRGPYVPPLGTLRREYVPPLPWVISALTIFGVALHEENMMVKKHGEKYAKYRVKTPFMLPLPRHLSTMITAPAKALLKKRWPENRKEVAYTITVYGIALVLLSLPLLLFFPI